ncbi:MAG: ABC-type amino acid transport substrate-binding protein [Planctomycetota bacterium]|jgi:ABC-type amino acid transport substrate-binding protein
MRILTQLVACLFLLVSCQSGSSEPTDVWRVASDLANPPFAWVDDEGTAQGRDVEMAQALAAELGRELEWDRMAFDELLGALESGRVDSVIATMGATPERAEIVLLSEPYFATSLSVLVRKGAGEPTSFADLDNRLVSAGIGTTSELALREKLPHAQAAEPSAKGESSIDRLLSRDVDALVMDAPDALDYSVERPDELMVLATPLSEELYIVAVRPDAPELLTKINAALLKLKQAGSLQSLDAKFGLIASRSER